MQSLCSLTPSNPFLIEVLIKRSIQSRSNENGKFTMNEKRGLGDDDGESRQIEQKTN